MSGVGAWALECSSGKRISVSNFVPAISTTHLAPPPRRWALRFFCVAAYPVKQKGNWLSQAAENDGALADQIISVTYADLLAGNSLQLIDQRTQLIPRRSVISAVSGRTGSKGFGAQAAHHPNRSGRGRKCADIGQQAVKQKIQGSNSDNKGRKARNLSANSMCGSVWRARDGNILPSDDLIGNWVDCLVVMSKI